MLYSGGDAPKFLRFTCPDALPASRQAYSGESYAIPYSKGAGFPLRHRDDEHGRILLPLWKFAGLSLALFDEPALLQLGTSWLRCIYFSCALSTADNKFSLVRVALRREITLISLVLRDRSTKRDSNLETQPIPGLSSLKYK